MRCRRLPRTLDYKSWLCSEAAQLPSCGHAVRRTRDDDDASDRRVRTVSHSRSTDPSRRSAGDATRHFRACSCARRTDVSPNPCSPGGGVRGRAPYTSHALQPAPQADVSGARHGVGEATHGRKARGRSGVGPRAGRPRAAAVAPAGENALTVPPPARAAARETFVAFRPQAREVGMLSARRGRGRRGSDRLGRALTAGAECGRSRPRATSRAERAAPRHAATSERPTVAAPQHRPESPRGQPWRDTARGSHGDCPAARRVTAEQHARTRRASQRCRAPPTGPPYTHPAHDVPAAMPEFVQVIASRRAPRA